MRSRPLPVSSSVPSVRVGADRPSPAAAPALWELSLSSRSLSRWDSCLVRSSTVCRAVFLALMAAASLPSVTPRTSCKEGCKRDGGGIREESEHGGGED
jgi:hypothetical protein